MVVTEQLKAIGINVNLIATDYATWLTNLGDTQLMDLFVTDVVPTPIPNTLRFISPVRTGFTNLPALQDILAEMNSIKTIDEAQNLWVDGQKMASENALVVMLGNSSDLNAVKTNVENYEVMNGMCLWDTKAKL